MVIGSVCVEFIAAGTGVIVISPATRVGLIIARTRSLWMND